MEHNSLPLKMMAESQWRRPTTNAFAVAWQADSPIAESADSTIHVVAGLLLPIWKRCRTSRPRLPAQTDAGERIIGRKVSPAGWRPRWLATHRRSRRMRPSPYCSEVRTVLGLRRPELRPSA